MWGRPATNSIPTPSTTTATASATTCPSRSSPYPNCGPRPRSPRRSRRRRRGELILQKVQPADTLVLLDEHGREPRSVELAAWLEKKRDHGAPPRLRHRRTLRLLPGGLCARQRADLALAPHVLPPDGAPRLRGAALSRVYNHKRGEVSPRVVAVGVLFPFFPFFFLLSFLILLLSLLSFPFLSSSFLFNPLLSFSFLSFFLFLFFP